MLRALRALVASIGIAALLVNEVHGQGVLVVEGATLIDVVRDRTISSAVVIVERGRISQVGVRGSLVIPEGATLIDASGKFLLPGLADMHNHMLSGSFPPVGDFETVLRQLAYLGITTVLNPSIDERSLVELKTATSVDSSLASFYGTGPIFTVEGGALGSGLAPRSRAEAAEAVRRLAALGVDAIKVSRDDLRWSSTRRSPLMPLDVLAAIVEEAHRLELKVFAHAPVQEYAKEALRAGVDGLLHGIIDAPVDAELLGLMKSNDASYVPTIGLYEAVADYEKWIDRQASYFQAVGLLPPDYADRLLDPRTLEFLRSMNDDAAYTRERLEIQRQNLRTVFKAGIRVVLGTDTGFFGVIVGAATRVELELMVEAGLPPLTALRAATNNAATMIDEDDNFGAIEPGRRADFLILDENPLEDVGNVSTLYRVVKGGRVMDPSDQRQR